MRRTTSGQTRCFSSPALGTQPHALTFFLTHDQRKAVLDRLNTLNIGRGTKPARTDALLAALGISSRRIGRATAHRPLNKGGRS